MKWLKFFFAKAINSIINEARGALIKVIKDNLIEVFNDEGFKLHVISIICQKCGVNKNSANNIYDEIIRILIRKVELICDKLTRSFEL